MKTDEKRDWSWEEPSEEEFERRRKSETFYRIYKKIEIDGEENEVILYKFWEKDDASALSVYNEFLEDQVGDPSGVFYSTSGYIVDPDGTRHDTFRHSYEAFKRRSGLFGKVRRLWWRTFGNIPDLWHRLKDSFRRFFTGHSISESWDLMYHVLDDLEYNLPMLIENAHGYPSAEGMTFDKWKGMLEDFLLHVRLFRFYESYGIVDEKDPDEVAFRDRWIGTIRTKPGTDGEIDYAKLHELQSKEWNSIVDFLRDWGLSLWD